MRRNYGTGRPLEASIGFSRAVRIGDVIEVAGTAPTAPDGSPVAPGPVALRPAGLLAGLLLALPAFDLEVRRYGIENHAHAGVLCKPVHPEHAVESVQEPEVIEQDRPVSSGRLVTVGFGSNQQAVERHLYSVSQTHQRAADSQSSGQPHSNRRGWDTGIDDKLLRLETVIYVHFHHKQ
jgi:hypothetical protein